MEYNTLKRKILNYLLEINPSHSIMAAAINGAAKYPPNFENLVSMIYSQYQDNESLMTEIVGAVPMRLILKYLKTK